MNERHRVMEHENYRYVLITPARNEEAFIETTIQSVIAQTRLPEKWIIVSDGSTDRTEAIVTKYAERYEWMELITMPSHSDRHFASKVHSFNRGYEVVKKEKYDIIGNLDADISFDREYFDFLLKKFEGNDRLGVAGTPFIEGGQHYDYRFTNIEHVSGACQLFRRECFEEIGGYIPIKSGGIDWVAVTTARMKGWKTRTFTEKTCLHHRKIGTGSSNAIMTWVRLGCKDFSLGNHPLWEILRTLYQMIKKPYIIGGTFLLFGFTWAGVKRVERPISNDLVQFIRKEQIQRLRNVLSELM